MKWKSLLPAAPTCDDITPETVEPIYTSDRRTKMCPDRPISVFSGPNRLPPGREERSGELEEGPCEEDQNAGVRTEAGEVSALPPTAASGRPQHTQIPQQDPPRLHATAFCTLPKKKHSSRSDTYRGGEHGGGVRFSSRRSTCTEFTLCGGDKTGSGLFI